MTPNEYADVIDYLEDRWTNTKAYVNAQAVYPDFAGLPHDAFRAAARQFYLGGHSRAPTFAELIEATRHHLGRYIDPTDPDSTRCDRTGRHGPLAVLPDEITGSAPSGGRDTLSAPPGHRVAICSRCRAEITRPAGQLTTDVERAEGKATREPPEGFDRSDRIAR